MSIKSLPKPVKGELYAQFVVEEYNCNYCPEGLEYHKDQGDLTKHIEWLYNATKELEKGDIIIISSEYVLLSHSDNEYTKGGYIQALLDAMKRGAKVFMMVERMWTGGRNSDGECGYCEKVGNPWECDEDSETANMWYYCPAVQYQLKLFTEQGGNNFILYDIEYKGEEDYYRIHSHFKSISCYYSSSNRCSVYKGSWNLSTSKWGNMTEEAGFGFTGILDENWAQYQLYIDMNHLRLFENYYPTSVQRSPIKITEYLQNYVRGEVPTQPITIPKLITCGPNYCDPNFGCGAVGGRPDCDKKETYVTSIDINAIFTFGIDPKPQDNALQDDWNNLGYPVGMVYGGDLVLKLVSTAKKFLKVQIPREFLDLREEDLLPGLVPKIHDMLKNDIPLFLLQNSLWHQHHNPVISSIYNDEVEKYNIYPKVMGLCGKQRSHSSNPNEQSKDMLHTKLWITDNAVLLSTAQPNIIHYNSDLTNYELLVENASGFNNFLNNHFNYVYNNCGIYTGEYPPLGKYNVLSDVMLCASDSSVDGCCTNSTDKIVEITDYLGSCDYKHPKKPLPPVPVPLEIYQAKSLYSVKNLLLFFVLGVIYILIYKNKKITKKVKIIVGIVFFILFIFIMWISNPKQPITVFSENEYSLMRTYLQQNYPTSNWFNKASNEDIGKYLIDTGFYYRQPAEGFDLFTYVWIFSQQLKVMICPTTDCCPNDYPRIIDSSFCDGSKCIIKDSDLDKLKYGILPKLNQLTWLTAMIGLGDILVLRNQYDPSDWTKSIYYAPEAQIADKKGWNDGAIKLNTGGFPSGQAVEVFRLHSLSGSPNIFYYASSGSGNFLKLGGTLQAVDKVQACLKLISLASKYGFRGFTSSPNAYKNNPIIHKTTTDPSTFEKEPEYLLLELLETIGKYGNTAVSDETFQFSLSIPTRGVLDFINKIGMLSTVSKQNNDCGVVGSDKPKPYTKWYISDAGYVNIKPLLIWYYKQKGVDIPSDFWYENINNWTPKQKLCIRNFFLNISDPNINLKPLKKIKLSWEAKYIINRIANSDLFDFILRPLIVQDKFSAPAFDINGNPWDGLLKQEIIETVQLSIQPSGMGGWDYEVIDYRFIMRNFRDWDNNNNTIGSSDAITKWDEYSKKYLFTGSPFKGDKTTKCKFMFGNNRSFILSECKR